MLQLPKVGSHLILSVPQPKILLLTLNRPKQFNSITPELEQDIDVALNFLEQEPSLWCAIISSNGKAFCAGADLKGWLETQSNQRKDPNSQPQFGLSGGNVKLSNENIVNQSTTRLKEGGFASISSRRWGRKPLIAAVDGITFGGGMEMILNCDLVVATSRSKFALPEVSRGVVAAQGGIARLTQICGHQRASELLLLGTPVSASEAFSKFGFLNSVLEVPDSISPEEGNSLIEQHAINEYALKILKNSPDSVGVTKESLLRAKDGGDRDGWGIDQSAFQTYWSESSRALYAGDNIAEGLNAFKEKRETRWENPTLIKGKL